MTDADSITDLFQDKGTSPFHIIAPYQTLLFFKGYPISSTNPYILCLALRRHNLAVGYWIGDDCLLEQPVEQQTP